MTERLAVVVPVYNEPSIQVTLASLYNQEHRQGVQHFVVDNGSTDDTRAVIDNFMATHDDFPLTLIHEEEKGTGAASDTGFLEAIDRGYTLLARTDGDSAPSKSWTNRIVDNFAANGGLKLLGGKSVALRDEYYRRGDDMLLATAVKAARITLSILHLDGDFSRAVVGHNLATSSKAYEQVGGFERSSIDDCDEDIEYSLKVAKFFGRHSIFIDSRLEVATSMRRIREYGIGRTALHHAFPNLRRKSGRIIDVR